MKIRVSSAYAYLGFVIGVLLVGTLTTIEVPCPIDGGTGVITGAEGLEIKGVEIELVNYEVFDLGCGEIFSEYTYAVKISVVNETITPSYGSLVVAFHDPEGAMPEHIYEAEGLGEVVEPAFLGPKVAEIPIFIQIPAETAENVEEIIRFTGFRFEERTHSISAEIAGEIACPYSNGTGKVTITKWLWIKANVQ